MIDGRVALKNKIDSLKNTESHRLQGHYATELSAPVIERYSFKQETPFGFAPLVDDVAALAGLIHARMQVRSMVTGDQFPYGAAHALAVCLSAGRSASYEQLQQALDRGQGAVRGIVQYLTRVGLLSEDGETVSLVARPVHIEVSIDNSGSSRRVLPGETPHLAGGERVRIVASSHLSLEIRVFRVFHRLSGGTAMRSISMKCVSRSRPAVVELELDGDGCDTPGVEQLLVHVGWSAMTPGDWELDETPPTCTPGTMGASLERERRELCDSAGTGWVTEYLFPFRL